MEIEEVKLRAGKYKIPCKIEKVGNRLTFNFPYNQDLIAEIKVMEGSKYHGYDPVPRKVWSIADTPANRFQLDYLKGNNPYAWYDRPLVEYVPERKPYAHQINLTRIGLTYHYVLWGAEMGTGKTLAAIQVMESSGAPDWFWVAPKSALNSAKLEFRKWDSKVRPYCITYDALKKILEGWQPGMLPPHGVVFDESSRLKNHTTQRSQAAQWLADFIRETWGVRGYVIEMSGSPAPKAPTDWWSQCKIACPGFLREGRFDKFKERLCLIKKAEGEYGTFPKLITWWDDPKKCRICGMYEADNPMHDSQYMAEEGYHCFMESVDEVSYLYKRMKGLVTVLFKKDCLDLPEKQYKIIYCPPTQDSINGARLIVARGDSAIKTMTYLRELSDGFQYKQVKIGEETCWGCRGTRQRLEQTFVGPELSEDQLLELGIFSSEQNPEATNHPEWFVEEIQACSVCKATGVTDITTRETVQVPCPKEDALIDILEEHEDVGRIVVYGGFEGTLDRCTSILTKSDWHWIRIDGMGYRSDLGIKDPLLLLEAFQNPDKKKRIHKIGIIAQGESGGMGLNLTESPTIVYYSNSFNAESRIQSEDRIHRIGMTGANIIDLIHLPSDKLVLDNLKEKRELQYMTMGELRSSLANIKIGEFYR